MSNYVLEVCCGSYDDCIQAELGGADRIELNSALSMGGLTPSIASVTLAKAHVHIPIIAMVRPRGAGFYYDEKETKVMMEDAKALLEAGVDGIAFGFLNADHTIDIEKTKQMTELIHHYQKEAVYHRALDCIQDIDEAMKQLIHLQIDRILTSGLEAKAVDGISLITRIQATYGSQIEILAGSGINETNAFMILQTTGVSQVHSSCKKWLVDMTTSGNHVSYQYDAMHDHGYDAVDQDKVKQLATLIHQ